jgi:ketosteroid isomerase-like protein
MSRENVEIVRKVYDAWACGDPSQAFEYLDPDVVWEAIEDAPDAGTYRKHSGVKRYMDDWLQDFEMLPFEFGRSIDADGRLTIEQRGTTKGKGSGLTTVINYAAVYTFRDDKVLTVKEYNSYAEALEAVGLSEQEAHAES